MQDRPRHRRNHRRDQVLAFPRRIGTSDSCRSIDSQEIRALGRSYFGLSDPAAPSCDQRKSERARYAVGFREASRARLQRALHRSGTCVTLSSNAPKGNEDSRNTRSNALRKKPDSTASVISIHADGAPNEETISSQVSKYRLWYFGGLALLASISC